MFAITMENLKELKIYIYFIIYSKFCHEYEKIFKEEESIEILKIILFH